MKKIEAFIKNRMLNEVIEQLHTIDGLTGISTFDIKGFGRAREKSGPVHIVDNSINWEPHVKLEIFCLDEMVETVIEIVQKSAHTGLRADGKIYVIPVEEAVRISTGERGNAAI